MITYQDQIKNIFQNPIRSKSPHNAGTTCPGRRAARRSFSGGASRARRGAARARAAAAARARRARARPAASRTTRRATTGSPRSRTALIALLTVGCSVCTFHSLNSLENTLTRSYHIIIAIVSGIIMKVCLKKIII